MNVLVIGQQGQLGTELLRARWPQSTVLCALTQQDWDLTQRDKLPALLTDRSWDLIVNAAAYTAVDQAESEPDLAFAINEHAPAAIAAACAKTDVPFIHVSTDYVFDGSKDEPYTEDDPINPINTYGASKAAGEQAVRSAHAMHIILRTSWLYSPHGRNFAKSMINLAEQRDELRIVNDQHGCPTTAGDLAGAIARIAEMIAYGQPVKWGTFHYAGRGATTWYGLAEAVLDTYHALGGKRPALRGIPTSEYPTPARRPANSRLDCTRIEAELGIVPRPWRESCTAVVKEIVAAQAEVTQ